jgi:2-oxoglutarate dehydrogenase E2 component (dihydrolipoamide succinyltransferase)
MAETKVIMPQMGESIFEGTITKWLKKAGERIERDEPLFEISTDKVDSEIPAPASGVVKEILVKEGQTVQINTVVAVIGDGDMKAAEAKPSAPAPAAAAKPAEPAKPSTPAPQPTAQAQPPAQSRPQAQPQSQPQPTTVSHGDLRSSPLVRRIARENNVNLNSLTGRGTGINGRITKRDILSYIEQGAPPPAPAAAGQAAPAAPAPSAAPVASRPAPSTPAPAPMTFSGDVERVQMTNMRKSIAEHMIASRRTSAHVTTFFEVDCTNVMKAREKMKAEFERSGVRLTVTPFFVQAAVNALKRFPIINSSLDGDTIVYKRAINIGIAVNLDWGLIVPVIKNAEEKNLLGLARALNDLGERARNKKLTPDDVKDGTFTITNPGQYGGLIGTPIINQPQVAIMGMGGIKKRAVVIDDAIAIRSIIILSLSFDHRIIDGAVADQFMADVQKQLESLQP